MGEAIVALIATEPDVNDAGDIVVSETKAPCCVRWFLVPHLLKKPWRVSWAGLLDEADADMVDVRRLAVVSLKPGLICCLCKLPTNFTPTGNYQSI